ncbi:MAG: nuclear transport factor 2 family protein [Steroidobacteraceae bacterium]
MEECVAAISQLVNRYAIAVDERDWQTFADCFAGQDAEFIDYQGKRIRGAQTIAASVAPMVARFTRTQHMNGVPFLSKPGASTSSGILYCIGVHVLEGAAGGEVCTVGARYDDEYVCQNGQWLIRTRKVIPLWTTGNLAIMG